ncbi:hypothetical protein VHUM_03039 [Vanrija humicola]|uniref:NAD-dependent epimerase/dehydratase domain-containing protein n=1 Tax=Vanrija humicola TaxID=5417 RepID=A0A7D8V4P9_VANHU|nr:hypothetical protein VHUM_03039 [Vanrija humicola]
MPAVNSGLILITGASGYIGAHTVKAALDAGYTVRVAVRTPEKGEYVKRLFPEHSDSVSYTIVENIETKGAYDKAIDGIDGVIHLASPVDLGFQGPASDMIGQAVSGVSNLLNALTRTSVKRVVILSSIASIGIAVRPDSETLTKVVYTEAQWNEDDVADALKLEAAAPGVVKYAASKTQAERAFWKWLKDNDATFDGVAINPSFNFGPSIAFGQGIPESVKPLIPWLKPGADASTLKLQYAGIVDVRDVAFASVKALSAANVAGERFILSADTLFNNDLAVGATKDEANAAGLTRGNADPAFRAELDNKAIVYVGSKAETAFGFKYRAKDDTIAETVDSIRKTGAAL